MQEQQVLHYHPPSMWHKFIDWFRTIPREHQYFAAAFDAEMQATLRYQLWIVWLSIAAVMTVSRVIDYILYYYVYEELLYLRVALVLASLISAFVVRWKNNPIPFYPTIFLTWWVHGIIVSLMLATCDDISGIFSVPLFVVIAASSFLSLPSLWRISSVLSICFSYLGIVLFFGDIKGQEATFTIHAINMFITALICLPIQKRHMTQHWKTFYNHHHIEMLNGQLNALTDRLRQELDMAKQIQQSLLPDSQPTVKGLDVACFSQSAREVGGDFYYYHSSCDNHVVVAIGDVSGKGLPAALLMSASITVLQTTLQSINAPSTLLAEMDRQLQRYTHASRQNCGLCYGEIQGTTLKVANAGGITPLIKRANGEIEWIDVGGMPLGIGLGAKTGYREATYSLTIGDMLILMSDGIIEATSKKGELFGFDRTAETIARAPTNNALDVLSYLRRSVDFFARGAEPHDDMTIVIVIWQ